MGKMFTKMFDRGDNQLRNLMINYLNTSFSEVKELFMKSLSRKPNWTHEEIKAEFDSVLEDYINEIKNITEE